MTMFKRLPLFVAPFVLFACSEAKFTGNPSAKATQDQQGETSNPSNPTNPTDNPTNPSDPTNPSNNPADPANPANPSSDPSDPSDPTSPQTPTTPCTPSQQAIGAEIAFLIDNSNSNAATDCPSSKKYATVNGVDLYECQGQTNREKAVLAAHELLANVAAGEPGNARAASNLSIASFPTANDYVNGHEVHGGWLGSSSTKDAVANAMLFARKPLGLTPYGAALTGGTELFATAANDGRAKVAVLVTDGEPTDQDPSGVLAKAEALKQAGVTIITVFVTNSEARQSRETKHTAMLKKIVGSTNNNWYSTAEFPTFAAYMNALLGGQGKKSLVEKISAKVVEVENSAALKDAFLSIIKTQAIACEQ